MFKSRPTIIFDVAHNQAGIDSFLITFKEFIKKTKHKKLFLICGFEKNKTIKHKLNILNKYFDFIYVDGDHSYEAVLADLLAWYPKLKKFGVMCGDDYGHPSGLGVIKAVNEFAYKHRVIVTCEADNQFYFVKV